MKKSAQVFNFAFLYFLFVCVLQAYFYNLQKVSSEKTKTIISSLLKYEKINQNPYTLSESLQTLEQSGVIKCTTLSLGKDEYIYFNTFRKDECKTDFLNLNGKYLDLKLKSISGVYWNIRTISLNPETFNSMLLFARFLIFLIQIFIFFIFVYYDKNKKLQIELMHKEALIYQQVSHDVRSPVFVLKTILQDSNFSGQNIEVLKSAFARLDLILQDAKLKQVNAGEILIDELDIVQVVNEVVSEKKLINKGSVQINVRWEQGKSYFVKINKSQMQRVVSNLLNNSIEASESNSVIDINIYPENSNVKVTIQDNGTGFPPGVLEKIGKEKVSVGKINHEESGSGLGLMHACNWINKHGGKIKFSNNPQGAFVEIEIKLLRTENCLDVYNYLYIEDDQMMCFLWSEKAKKKGVNLKIINHPDQFESIKNQINFNTKIYCDSKFDGAKGEDLLNLLYEIGYRNLYLTTGYKKTEFEPTNKYVILEKTIPF